MKQYKETSTSLLYKSLSDFVIFNAGYEACDPNHIFGPAFREFNLIHFVMDGKGELTIDNHTFQLSKGDAFIIPANKISTYKANQNTPWTYFWLGYLGINSQKYTSQLLRANEEIYVFKNLNNEYYYNEINKILNMHNNHNSMFFRANSILLEIFANLFDEIGINDNLDSKTTAMEEIKYYIDLNYPLNLTVTQIAEKFGFNSSYLSRTFSNKFGISPKQYILKKKINKACELLITTDLPISIIANSLSFDDQLAFSKIFKKNKGCSPLQFRKKNTISKL